MERWADVSQYNDVERWEDLEGAVNGVILRCGYGNGEQDYLWDWRRKNVVEKRPEFFGAYFAPRPDEEAVAQAEFLISLLPPKLAFVMLDLEGRKFGPVPDLWYLWTEKGVDDFVHPFCERLDLAGYKVVIYGARAWLDAHLKPDHTLGRYPLVQAAYTGPTTFAQAFTAGWPALPGGWTAGTRRGWQFTDKGGLPGVKGPVDLSLFHY